MLYTTKNKPEWNIEGISPFDEMLLSWNGTRPATGNCLFYVSVKMDTWSPPLLYASWGSEGQSSFLSQTADAAVVIYQDIVQLAKEKKATGFKVQVTHDEEASLDCIRSLYVCTNGVKQEDVPSIPFTTIYIPLKGLSQMALDSHRKGDLCSPTSTTAVVRYLTNSQALHPLSFAERVWDAKFDQYGNWVFNVAQASAELGAGWSCWVERLPGFGAIHERLRQNTPVIVSIRGPLKGSALPYSRGHLIAICGYHADKQQVLCMDPAFATDDQTLMAYDLADFMQAWQKRGKIAYIFSRNN